MSRYYYIDAQVAAEREAFDAHYADEIEGRAEYPLTPGEEMPALRNAPGQLRLFGVAY